jgi:uncharacterized membrane protein YgcG
MSAVNVYKQKVQLKGYEKSVEVEQKVASGELPVLMRSLRWGAGYAPFDSLIKKLAGVLPELNRAGLGTYIATLEEAMGHMIKPIPNYVLAAAAAARGVLVLLDLGVDQNKAVAITANALGLSKSLIEKALSKREGGRGGGGGGGGGGAAAGGGAPGA